MGTCRAHDNGARYRNLDDSSATAIVDIEEFPRFDEWNSVSKAFFRSLKDERGSVESALVLIPVVLLFLVGMQIAIALGIRNNNQVISQSGASTRAISGNLEAHDTLIRIKSPDKFQELDLLVSHRRSVIPSLVPGIAALLGRDLTSSVSGIAVVEAQR